MSNIQALSAAAARGERELAKRAVTVRAQGARLTSTPPGAGCWTPECCRRDESFNAAVRVPGGGQVCVGRLYAARRRAGPGGHRRASTANITRASSKRAISSYSRFYTAILLERPHVNAAMHTHSHHIEAFATRPPTQSRWRIARCCSRATDEPIPVTPWEPRYSAEPFKHAMRINPTAPAILVGNHGPFAWGARLE